MRRRRFITAAGIVGATALAGCVNSGDSGGDDGGETDDGDDGGENDDGGTVPPADLERVDEPPHGPERPPDPDDPEEWNADWPGEGMATEPSVGFERVSVPLAERQLTDVSSGKSAYAVALVTSREQLGSRIDLENAPARLENVDFAEEAVVVVESGFGSSTVTQVWNRVESVEDGLHLHGYHTDPVVGTDDISPRHSVLVVEASPDDIGRAYASLTVGESRRVNVHSDEGVIEVREADGG